MSYLLEDFEAKKTAYFKAMRQLYLVGLQIARELHEKMGHPDGGEEIEDYTRKDYYPLLALRKWGEYDAEGQTSILYESVKDRGRKNWSLVHFPNDRRVMELVAKFEDVLKEGVKNG